MFVLFLHLQSHPSILSDFEFARFFFFFAFYIMHCPLNWTHKHKKDLLIPDQCRCLKDTEFGKRVAA